MALTSCYFMVLSQWKPFLCYSNWRMSLFIFNELKLSSYEDTYGNEYADSAKTILKKAASSLSGDITIRAEITTILGDSNATSPFVLCRENLNSVTFAPLSKVSKIGVYCFAYSSIVSADLSRCNLLKTINSAMFRGCSLLSSVHLPPNTEEILHGAFDSTKSLKRIEIPDSVTYIAPSSEYGRVFGFGALEEIVISHDSKLQYLGGDALTPSFLTSFFIPKDLTNLASSAFAKLQITFTIHPENTVYKTDGHFIYTNENNSTLLYASAIVTGEYVVPSYVTDLSSAFRGGRINAIKLHDKVSKIESWCFASCPLKEFRFPALITVVARRQFNACGDLETVYLTEQITEIQSYAFVLCTKLKNIILPSSLRTIRDHAFMGCNALKSIALPEKISLIGDGVFQSIDSITITSQNPQIYIDWPLMYIDNNQTFLQYFGSDKSAKITLLSSCTKISAGSFASKNIGSISFSSSPTLSVGDEAFKSSTITSIDFPSGLTSLGLSSFQDCLLLKTVKFAPNTALTSIPDYCFMNCPLLKDFVLPQAMQAIGKSAFSGCSSLSDIGFANTAMINISTSAFTYSGITNADLPSTIEKIGESAFASCKITSFTAYCDIPSYCCSSCVNLETINIHPNAATINDYAFDGCVSLDSFNIPTTLQSILGFAFRSCISLISVSLPLNSHLNQVNGGCFLNCKLLKKLTLDSNDKEYRFENGALTNYNQTRLITFLPYSDIQTFVVPQEMEYIGKYAFMGSPNLIRVIFYGNKIKDIGLMAFKDCKKLNWIYFSSNSLRSIGNNAFDGCPNLQKCGSISSPYDIRHRFVEQGINPIAFSTDCNYDCATLKNSYYIRVPFLSPFIVMFL